MHIDANRHKHKIDIRWKIAAQPRPQKRGGQGQLGWFRGRPPSSAVSKGLGVGGSPTALIGMGGGGEVAGGVALSQEGSKAGKKSK